jgi:biotin carboxylase
MQNNRIVMVMPYRQLVRKAVAAGFRVWAIWDSATLAADARAEIESLAERLVLIDFADQEGLLGAVKDLVVSADAGHVVHLGREETMVAVAEEAEALGVAPNPAAALRALNDKIATRRLGVSEVRVGTAASADDVRAVLDTFGLPAVVKPAGASGSRGVALLRTSDDLDRWRTELDRGGLSGPFLVEEVLTGPEFSVETLTVDGRHLVIGVTAKQTTGPPHFVETAHLHPAPLAEADRAAMTGLAVRVLDAAGYRFGPAHTEIILTADGPRLVESQARLGGDRIPVLVQEATGLDVEAAIFEALAGREVRVDEPSGYAAVTFFALPPGPVTALEGVDAIKAQPWLVDLRLNFEVGDELPPTTDSRSRHGHAIVRASTPDEAAARSDLVQRLLSVRQDGTGEA